MLTHRHNKPLYQHITSNKDIEHLFNITSLLYIKKHLLTCYNKIKSNLNHITMNYRILTTVLMLVGLTLNHTTQAQKVNLSLNELKEVFKKETDCNYCHKAFSFAKTMQQMLGIANELTSAKSKKRKKKLQRFDKILNRFIDHSETEHSGLSQELEFAKEKNRELTVRKLIKLNTHIKRLGVMIDEKPDLRGDPELDNSRKRVADMERKLGNTLITLKQQ